MVINYFTPGVSTMLRHQVKPFFIHTYTRTPLLATPDDPNTTNIDESQDAWGDEVNSYGTAVNNLPCLYMEQSMVDIGPAGPVQINRALLLVPDTDLAQPGDLVSNIYTLPDAKTAMPTFLLLLGPVRIEDTHTVAPMVGGVIYKDLVLREVVEVL